MVWIETPTNPTLMMIDIKAVVDLLKRDTQVLVVVDNTFMTPYFQRPLDFGAHIVLHSISKYLNGMHYSEKWYDKNEINLPKWIIHCDHIWYKIYATGVNAFRFPYLHIYL